MLGIVIANWNGEKLIDKCLKSLENQTFKDFKVYIIDNNSKDNSKEVIRKYFQWWLDKDCDAVKEIFSDDIIYSECYGPVYNGIGQIIR